MIANSRDKDIFYYVKRGAIIKMRYFVVTAMFIFYKGYDNDSITNNKDYYELSMKNILMVVILMSDLLKGYI